MLQLISEFKRQGYSITFACASNLSDNSADLDRLGINSIHIQLNHNSFNDILAELKPDAVLFDRFMTEEQYGWRVAEVCPNALRILDTEDLHGLRKAREMALKDGRDMTIKHLQNEVTKREIASIYRCDLSLIISEAEMTLLKDHFKIDCSLLYYLPFLLEPSDPKHRATLPAFKDRMNFISIGNFLHAPNYDAVLELKYRIWPLIRKQLPQAELHIYGAYANEKINQLHNIKDGFIIKGYAEDVNNVMRSSRVLLAPLRFGAGLKGKLIDAMHNGTPAVMTTIAAEGMLSELEPNGHIAHDNEEFAQRSLELYQNENIWNRMQSSGFKVLDQRFNKNLFVQDFELRVSHLSEKLSKHRQNNFIGSLIMHQTIKVLSI